MIILSISAQVLGRTDSQTLQNKSGVILLMHHSVVRSRGQEGCDVTIFPYHSSEGRRNKSDMWGWANNPDSIVFSIINCEQNDFDCNLRCHRQYPNHGLSNGRGIVSPLLSWPLSVGVALSWGYPHTSSDNTNSYCIQ